MGGEQEEEELRFSLRSGSVSPWTHFRGWALTSVMCFAPRVLQPLDCPQMHFVPASFAYNPRNLHRCGFSPRSSAHGCRSLQSSITALVVNLAEGHVCQSQHCFGKHWVEKTWRCQDGTYTSGRAGSSRKAVLCLRLGQSACGWSDADCGNMDSNVKSC